MKTAEWRSTLRPDTHQVKPTAAISAPKLFSGRRYQANRPVPMNVQPMSGPNTAVSAGSLMSSGAESARTSGTAPAMNPATPRAQRARRSPITR